MNRFFEGGLRTARRFVVGVVGATIVAFGVALLVLPGPAFVVIPIGLGVLAIEFEWARRSLRRVRESIEAAGQGLSGNSVAKSDQARPPDAEAD